MSDGLIAHYKFEGNFIDFKGNYGDAINHGTSFTTGKINNIKGAIYFG